MDTPDANPLPPPSLRPGAAPQVPSDPVGSPPPPPPQPYAGPYGTAYPQYPGYPPPVPYAAPQYAYATPADGPAAGLRYAGFGIRALAYLVDSIGLFAVVLLASIPLGGMVQNDQVATSTTVSSTIQANPSVQLFSTLLGAVYFVGFWAGMGRTPGQRLLGLRVLRAADGRPIGIGQAIGRYVGLVISLFAIGLGVIWVAFDPRRQGWHDKMAGTFVVREVG